MVAKEKAILPERDPLEELFPVRFADLTFYFDTEKASDNIGADHLYRIHFAYHEMVARFVREVLNEDPAHHLRNFFPRAGVVLTEKRQVFASLYPNRKNFDSLPAWVPNYVNFKRSLYVRLFENRLLIPGINRLAHELLHISLPDFLGLPPEQLEVFLSRWGNEGTSVVLGHQLQPAEWLTHQLRKSGVVIPNIGLINETGFFSQTPLPAEVNPWYQYAAHTLSRFGEALAKKPSSPKLPPLGQIFHLAVVSCAEKRNETLIEAGLRLGIDQLAVENSFRKQLGIPVLL